MSLDSVLNRLVDALEARGIEPPASAESTEAISAYEALLSPYRLPADLRRLWERIDVSTLRVCAYPCLTSPEHLVRFGRGEQLPRLLATIGYESHTWLKAELDGPWGQGAALVCTDVDGWYRLVALGITDLLTGFSEMLEDGAFALGRWGVAYPDPVTYLEDRVDRAIARGASPLHDSGEYTSSPLSWPSHWRTSEEVDEVSIAPRGATLTIAEALRQRDQEVSGTIVGHVTRSMLFERMRLTVVDDTGQMDVELDGMLTAIRVHADLYEFDITMRPGTTRSTAVDAGRRHVE